MGVLFCSVLVFTALPASAHTQLDYTTPGDGDTVDEPVSEVVVAFSEPVNVVGDGFEVLDPQGNVIAPNIVTTDDKVFTLTFDSPLAGGDVGVRYEVESEDGHVIAGGFSFGVAASEPTTTTSVDDAASTSQPTDTSTTQATPTTAPGQPSTSEIGDAGADTGGLSGGSGALIAIGAVVLLGGGTVLALRSRNSDT